MKGESYVVPLCSHGIMLSMNAFADITEQVKPIFKKYGIKRASIFGSFARGDARGDSDVDFLFTADSGTLSLFDLAGMRRDLMEALGRDVDLVSERALAPQLRSRIQDVKIVYER